MNKFLLKVATVVLMTTGISLITYVFFTQQLWTPFGGMSVFLTLCSIHLYAILAEGDKR